MWSRQSFAWRKSGNETCYSIVNRQVRDKRFNVLSNHFHLWFLPLSTFTRGCMISFHIHHHRWKFGKKKVWFVLRVVGVRAYFSSVRASSVDRCIDSGHTNRCLLTDCNRICTICTESLHQAKAVLTLNSFTPNATLHSSALRDKRTNSTCFNFGWKSPKTIYQLLLSARNDNEDLARSGNDSVQTSILQQILVNPDLCSQL